MSQSAAGLLLLAILLSACATAAPPSETDDSMPSPFDSLIPLPASIEILQDPPFRGGQEMRIVVPDQAELIPIAESLARLTGATITTDPDGQGEIHLRLDEISGIGDEGYSLTIDEDRIDLRANTSAGIFYGAQTLRQLLPPEFEYESALVGERRPAIIPAARVIDLPRFEWRGAMLDVARHFFDVSEVKRYIDLMALYKLNRLHLHLSDDQGWRIEIDSWPALTGVGAATEVGGTPGGYYTQEELAEIVDYAAARFITVVPEIDMPGHTNAALASIPELNCDGVAREPYTGIKVGFSVLCVDREVTWQFIDDVVREITELAPGGYFHVGGDEVKKLGEDAYAEFIERVQKVVASHGAVTIGWDEIAITELLPGTIIQHWRPGSFPAAAAERGARVIFSPADKIYLDMKYDASTAIGQDWAALIPVRTSYEWDPGTVSEGVPVDSILGVEAPLWTETIANIHDLEFMAFPRLTAAAEIGWTPLERRSWDEFRKRLANQYPRWTVLGVNAYRSPEILGSDRGE